MAKRVNEQNAEDSRPSVGDDVEHVRTLLKRNIAALYVYLDSPPV
jgi:hypothetical protein